MNKLLRDFPADDILRFWFDRGLEAVDGLPIKMQLWFQGDETLDEDIAQRFKPLLEPMSEVMAEEYSSPQQLLAGVLLFDQFSRNCFRGQARAFSYDVFALDLLDYALSSSWDRELHVVQRLFLYMPLQHIESLEGQELGVRLFTELAEGAPKEYKPVLQNCANYAHQHRDIIARFGRFPHRNRVLLREPTENEQRYLSDGGATFGQ